MTQSTRGEKPPGEDKPDLPKIVFDCRHRYPSGSVRRSKGPSGTRSGFSLDVRFSIDKPIAAIVGPSGSGKTTVLSIVAGLLRPDEGSVQVAGRTLFDSHNRTFVAPERRGLGVLFQDHCLFPHMTVRANIRYGMKNAAGSKERDSIPLDQILQTLQISDQLLDRYPDSLSGGERQRVALARALACRPEYLLLDEPLTSVEDELRQQIAGFIETVISRFSIPMLLVSHNQPLVDRLAAQVIRIDQGRLVESKPD